MSPSQRYGNRVTASTSNPTLRKTSLDRLVTCSSHVFPFIFRCSLGRCHCPPVRKKHTQWWNRLNSISIYKRDWIPTNRLPRMAGREEQQPGWVSLCWEPATSWCPAGDVEDRCNDPAGSDSWSRHSGNQSAATRLYPALWAWQHDTDREEGVCFQDGAQSNF